MLRSGAPIVQLVDLLFGLIAPNALEMEHIPASKNTAVVV